jgi:DNA-binding response OmpR family regulator
METQHIQIKKIITETTGARKLKKILLIDEDKDSALSATLEQKGYDLIHCDSVQKAWGLVYPHRPQLIVLHLYDTNRLGLSNLQECRALEKAFRLFWRHLQR